MQRFNTSIDRPWALVRTQAQTPGKRPGTTVAWLEHHNTDGTFDGGEVWLEKHTGILDRLGMGKYRFWKNSRWRFTYKRQKRFAPENIIHPFPHDKGKSFNPPDNTVRTGGPLLVDINKVRKMLPRLPNYDEVERPAEEGGVS